MGHSSIQVTVDTYGHLVPGANVNWVDRLDAKLEPQPTATKSQQLTGELTPDSPEVIDKAGGGGWTRTNDLGIMSPSREIEAKEDKGLSFAESSKVRQNPQQIDNKKSSTER
jgi:hypothetical protein